MGRLFWIFFGLLAGAAAHISYVLFVPGLLFGRTTDQLTANGPGMQILAPDRQRNALPGFSGDSVAALCRLDLSKGKTALSLKVPPSYWTLAIYTQSGKQVYALNDKQAGVEQLDIVVSRTKSVIDQVNAVGDQGEVLDDIANAAWTVDMPDTKGIALLWAPLSDPHGRSAMEALVKQGTCGTK
jgi:uncharacterized membrane protein